MFLCFAFHRHVTHSAELYSLTVPFVVVVVLQTCHAKCSAVQSHCSFFLFSFSSFFLSFFFTDMSRAVLGSTISLLLFFFFFSFFLSFFFTDMSKNRGSEIVEPSTVRDMSVKKKERRKKKKEKEKKKSSEMSRTVLGSTISLLFFLLLLLFLLLLFYRHVTRSAGLYNLTAPVFCFVVVVFTDMSGTVPGLYNLIAPFFSFLFFLSFFFTDMSRAVLGSTISLLLFFFLPFFFTDMSRTVLGCSIAAAAVMLACLISLMCGVWPARCDPLKKPRLYLATSILLLLASESSASVPFCSRRYPSARKTPYTLHSVLDVFRTFPFKLFQLVTWASE